MATAADLLKIMPVFNNALRVENGDPDEARAIIALTAAQHYFETVAATYQRVLGTQITVSTVVDTETTGYPTTLLRLDAIWLVDATTGRPIRRLKRIEEVGGQAPSLPWPLQLTAASGQGSPEAYFADMSNFYWLPVPDMMQTLRIYGLIEHAEFETRNSPYSYPLRVKSAIAAFAVKILRTSLDDDTATIDSLAATFFGPLMRSLKQFDRSEPHGRFYGEVHDT